MHDEEDDWQRFWACSRWAVGDEDVFVRDPMNSMCIMHLPRGGSLYSLVMYIHVHVLKKTNCIFWLIDIELLLMAKFVCHLNSSAGANWTRWINRVESIFLINRQKKERILNTFMSLGGGGSRCTLTGTCYRLWAHMNHRGADARINK
jgi:hypothetical protein